MFKSANTQVVPKFSGPRPLNERLVIDMRSHLKRAQTIAFFGGSFDKTCLRSRAVFAVADLYGK